MSPSVSSPYDPNASCPPLQWTVGGTKGKKKVKPGKGSDKKTASKKKLHKAAAAAASGSSDGDSSAESSAPEEGESLPRVPARLPPYRAGFAG